MKKAWIVGISAAILLCIAVGLFFLQKQNAPEIFDSEPSSMPVSSALTWQEQYDLGVRYLSEGNYREAILAFNVAIEIDPKRPEAYLGLADAYEASGDKDSAQTALERGLEETEDDEIRSRLNPEVIDVESFMLRSELTLKGVPFYELNMSDIRDMFPTADAQDLATETRGYTHYSEMDYSAWSHLGADTLGGFSYHYWYGDDGTFYGRSPGFRDIQPQDTMDVILKKIGVTEQGLQKLRASIQQEEVVLADWVELPDQTVVQVSYHYRPDITDPKFIDIHWDAWPIEGENRMDVNMQICFQEDESLTRIIFACTDSEGRILFAG